MLAPRSSASDAENHLFMSVIPLRVGEPIGWQMRIAIIRLNPSPFLAARACRECASATARRQVAHAQPTRPVARAGTDPLRVHAGFPLAGACARWLSA